jgi:single-strand DNA-binding protein
LSIFWRADPRKREAIYLFLCEIGGIGVMIFVEIAGFLGADPEERFTANGKRVVTLRVAARVRQGGQDLTVWWRVNVWDDRFDKMLPYLKKGSAVIVLGEMSKPEIYTSRDGTPQISLTMSAEIIKFSPFGRPDRPAEAQAAAEVEDPFAAKPPFANQYAGAGVSGGQEVAFSGDDLPF